ncbi:MAG: DUF362 domain-containing protein [Chloroflexi bacterium]|nr:DUF362 domain-containing protein [Chloroflexota bacterium]
MTQFRVGIARGDDPKENVRAAVDLAGGWSERATRARRVFVKVNLTVDRESGSGAVTHVLVVEAIVELLKESGVRYIAVGDGTGAPWPTSRNWKAAGYSHLPGKYGVKLVDLNRARTRRVEVPDHKNFAALEIPEVVLDADMLVVATPPKTHDDGLFTLCGKSLFGIPPNRFYGAPRAIFHKLGQQATVYDINQAVSIDFAFIDGTVAMELGFGDGRPVPLRLIVAGSNSLAVDTVAMHLIGQDPRRCAYLRYLAKARGGPAGLDEIEVLGATVEEAGRKLLSPWDDPALAKADSADLKVVGKRVIFEEAPPKEKLELRPQVDRSACIGDGLCGHYCPEVFELRDDDKAYVIVERPDPSLLPKIELAARVCPTKVIAVYS